MRVRGRLSVVTVGCKANFADSAAILAHAARAGFEVVGTEPPPTSWSSTAAPSPAGPTGIAGRWPAGCAASIRARSS